MAKAATTAKTDTEKPKKENGLTAFGITQYMLPKYWDGLTDDEKELVRHIAEPGGVEAFAKMLYGRLTAAGIKLTEFRVIMHDKDSRQVWSDVYRTLMVETKPRHVHCLAKCSEGALLGAIATAAGVQPEFVEKPKKGRYAYDNMLAYLVHAKDLSKYQYETSEVVTVAGEPYHDIWKERIPSWIKARGKVAKNTAADNIDDLEFQILQGRITRSQILLTDELFAIYAHNRRRCNDALATYAERKAERAAAAIQRGDWRLTVFFVTGKPGAGKSWFAAKFVEYLCASNKTEGGQPWEVFKTAASNPLDHYLGEEVVLMDDIRGTAMSAEDWLKLLDPDHVNKASARYENVTPVPRVVVITSYKDPVEFFYYTKTGGGDRGEALDQFIRRVQSVVQVIEYNEERQYKLSSGVKHDEPKQIAVPGTMDKYAGGSVSVHMEYGFEEVGSYNMEDAMAHMASIVTGNDKTAADAQRLQCVAPDGVTIVQEPVEPAEHGMPQQTEIVDYFGDEHGADPE